MNKKLLDHIAVNGIDKLNDEDLAEYYFHVCDSIGLDPASRPLEYITLSGKKVLYVKKGATDLIAATRGLTRVIVEGPMEVMIGGVKLLQCKCRVTDKSGRTDEDVATVPATKNIDNAAMVCATKAKRRATLSFLGLGMLDESELDQIPGKEAAKPAHEPPPVAVMTSPLRTRIASATGKTLLGLAREVAEAAEEEKEAYTARWAELLPTYDDATLDVVLKRMEVEIPQKLREEPKLWDKMRDYLEDRLSTTNTEAGAA